MLIGSKNSPYLCIQIIYSSSNHLFSYLSSSDIIVLTSLQNGLAKWNQILIQLRFIRNRVIMDIQWMVCSWVLVHSGRKELPVIYGICMIVRVRLSWNFFSFHLVPTFLGEILPTMIVNECGFISWHLCVCVCVFFFQSWRKWPIVSWDFWLPVVCYFFIG